MEAGWNPTNTNPWLIGLVNAKINEGEEIWTGEFTRREFKKITWMSEFYEKQRRKLIIEIITTDNNNPDMHNEPKDGQ